MDWLWIGPLIVLDLYLKVFVMDVACCMVTTVFRGSQHPGWGWTYHAKLGWLRSRFHKREDRDDGQR